MGTSSDRERANERLERLYQISKLLTNFESVDRTIPATLAVVNATLPLRTAILIEKTEEQTRTIAWQPEGQPAPGMSVAKAHAEDAYAYLAGPSSPKVFDPSGGQAQIAAVFRQVENDAGPTPRAMFIVIPLVVERRAVFGVLQLEGVLAPDKADLMFVNAIANQIAVALDRHRAWQRDIVKRERAEEGRTTAEHQRNSAEALMDRYAALVDNLDHAFVWEADAATGRIIYVSARAEALLGYPRRQWTEEPNFWMNHLHPDERDAVRAILDEVVAAKEDRRCDHRYVGREGQILWLHTGLHLAGADTANPTIQAVSIDVTAAKNAEKIVLEQLNFTRAMAAGLGEGVVAADVEGRVVFINRATEDLLGWSEKDALGKAFEEIVPILDATGGIASRPLEHAIRTGERIGSDEQFFVRRDGTAFPASYSVAAIRLDGKTTGGIAAFQDITERKQAEAALQEAVRLREQILAIVSHDLRNPLGIIQMTVSMLLKTAPLQDRRQSQRKRFEIIDRSSHRMARLINDLRDFARIQSEQFDLDRRAQAPARLIEDVLASFEVMAMAAGLLLRSEIEEHLPAVECDRDRLFQVFSNLVGNAVQASTAGGSIVLGVRRRGSELLFSVSDTGPGIPEDQLGVIFERYRRGDTPGYEGTGLGLAIAQGIVRAHGGQIWAESTVGVGSRFYFTVPAAPAASPPLDDPEHALVVGPKRELLKRVDGGPILVVEDEQDIREAMGSLLEMEGFQVLTAANGSEALRQLREPGPRPSLILLDLMMPVMNGWAFIAERDKDPALSPIPVVVVSGMHGTEAAAASLHAVACVRKPLQAETLIDLARRYSSAAPDGLGAAPA